jgi:hypothetical protein
MSNMTWIVRRGDFHGFYSYIVRDAFGNDSITHERKFATEFASTQDAYAARQRRVVPGIWRVIPTDEDPCIVSD